LNFGPWWQMVFTSTMSTCAGVHAVAPLPPAAAAGGCATADEWWSPDPRLHLGECIAAMLPCDGAHQEETSPVPPARRCCDWAHGRSNERWFELWLGIQPWSARHHDPCVALTESTMVTRAVREYFTHCRSR
jgi:hypothetical protein